MSWHRGEGRKGTIGSMNDSMAQLSPALVRTDVPGWKSVLSWVSSLVLCALFLLSGLWKITDVQGTAVRMVQAKVPDSLGLPAALFFGIVETVGAVMILVPRLRRWGALVLGGAAAGVPRLLRDPVQHAARRRLQLHSVVEARGGSRILRG